MAGMDLEALDLLLIENVGNRVCPAEFDLGGRVMLPRSARVTTSAKYPLMFRPPTCSSSTRSTADSTDSTWWRRAAPPWR